MKELRSQCTGESLVQRPLSKEKFLKICDPSFETSWFCGTFGVSPVHLKQTSGTRTFSGRYHRSSETITYTKPYLGAILHELAHHICYKRNLSGRNAYHGSDFAKILQELIDDEA